MRQWDLDDLAGIGDLARERGVSSAAATNWRRQYPDFPEPLVDLSTGPVYSWAQVRAWWQQRWPEDRSNARQPQPYGHITADLRARIRAGEWEPGSRLPSRVALAEQYGVGERAMARPIADLCAAGLLTTIRASGTYVTAQPTRSESPCPPMI